MGNDDKIDAENLKKIEELNNAHVLTIIREYVDLCKPDKVTVLTGTEEDLDYVRKLALANGEEKKLSIDGHTLHYDGYFDQARDAEHTRVLLEEGRKMSKAIRTIPKDDGLREIFPLLNGIMKGKEMLVSFYCLGPNNSNFSIPALQLTDSAYVTHSENILYRQGYDEFRNLNGSADFFHFIHSAGTLDKKKNSKNTDDRRIYMDLENERVFSINNQYAGNSVGLKKLALRLAISKASREDWLTEHMFIMGVKPEGKDRTTYFTGAFPSMCGKTSTAMVPGQTIIGDDIAYLKIGKDGRAYAANVEQGIFGIIQDVNPKDDALIHEVLTTKRELIISNVLNVKGVPYWLGMGEDLPEAGENYIGKWKKGKKGPDGKEVPPANKNARYTIRISDLANRDPMADDPNGVPVSGIIYGGRDSDTNVPVLESLGWSHGVFLGAAIESETTAATIGAEGVRKHNPMANLEFLVIPLGTYIENHLKFGDDVDEAPRIFTTNYFQQENGQFLTEKVDKKAWLMWMEGRVHNEYDAIETPIGYIPKYDDLKQIFSDVFQKDFSKDLYEKLFSIRTDKLEAALDRIDKVYQQEDGIPDVFHKHIEQQRTRLDEAKKKYGAVISPFAFEKN